ncbi:hypothetical protein BDZ45DRAFT_754927 [Acephala macrosclerotiorum]|nr:hypothetical protein BDZ45DRAFT_754927 [Acephala macrosclerotiorum]
MSRPASYVATTNAHDAKLPYAPRDTEDSTNLYVVREQLVPPFLPQGDQTVVIASFQCFRRYDWPGVCAETQTTKRHQPSIPVKPVCRGHFHGCAISTNEGFFCSLAGNQHRQYKGRAFQMKKGKPIEISINGRIMVDAAMFQEVNPNYVRPSAYHQPGQRLRRCCACQFE